MDVSEKRWTVEVIVDEIGDSTRARAVLKTRDGKPITGLGTARSVNLEIPEIADELATSRALSDLSHKLLDNSIEDIEALNRLSTPQ